jgi:deazaflavin-dependent oxidoreductase (nitroreductase family)
MADSDIAKRNEFNEEIIAEFRANDGRVGGLLAGTPMLLLHHIGAKSGVERVTPLAYTPHGDDGFVIVAANGGSPTHPSWYYNLKTNPKIKIEVGPEKFTALPQELDSTVRTDLWPKLIAAAPSVAEHQAKTTRQIPLFVLTRED